MVLFYFQIDPRYEITSDVRGQIKFLEELDKAEQKRHEEVEREILLRAAKSRSKTEDPEQAKLKAKVNSIILQIIMNKMSMIFSSFRPKKCNEQRWKN
jgi:hypothetical protein